MMWATLSYLSDFLRNRGNNMKLTRMSTLVVSAAIAPAVLLASPAFAAGTAKAHVVSGPGAGAKASARTPEQQEKDDRFEILRLMGAKDAGPGLKAAGSKALDGGAAAMRHFLEVDQFTARDADNEVLISKIINKGGPGVREWGKKALEGTPQDRVRFLEEGQFIARFDDDRVRTAQIFSAGGPSVREAARKALREDTPEAIKRFLEVDQFEARAIDNRVLVSKIINDGGPAVKAAGKKALRGTPEDVQAFLDKGQFEARKKDEADAAAGKSKPTPKPKPKPETGRTGDDKGGKPAPGDEKKTGGAEPAAAKPSQHKTTADDGSTALASTGAGSVLPWAAGGTALALVGGAGLLITARRRRSAEG